MNSRLGSPALPRPPRTIRRTLVHIVLACALPAWLGFAVLIFGMYRVLDERTPQGALMTAHALTLAVDRELAITQTALELLARSDALTAGDLAAFRQRAMRDAEAFALHNVVLVRRTGEQLVNTLLPPDAKAPPSARVTDNETVARTGKPLILNMLKGGVTGSLLVGIKVPVIRDGSAGLYGFEHVSAIAARLEDTIIARRAGTPTLGHIDTDIDTLLSTIAQESAVA